MNLAQFCPHLDLERPDMGVRALMRAILTRANFVPAVRGVIGWRGLASGPPPFCSWTAKVKGLGGVFGLEFDAVEECSAWSVGRFILSYFPHPEEALVESLAVAAATWTQLPDYLPLIRRFPERAEFAELFQIGRVRLGVKPQNMGDGGVDGLMLELGCLDWQRSVALDGLRVTMEGREVEIVPPGGVDQNFPALDVAWPFFEALAASVSFNVGAPPNGVFQYTRPWEEMVYNGKGEVSARPAEDVRMFKLALGYGDMTGLPTQGERSDDERAYPDALWWQGHAIGERKSLDKSLLGVEDRPPLLVVSGFLGAGKTTFLRHFIEHQVGRNRFVAVIQNEIGQTGLDGKLLDQDYGLVEVDEGCICCTLIGKLTNAVRQILTDFTPDYILLETSGLANPFNLLDDIQEVAELVRFDSVTIVADAANVERSMQEYEVCQNQIKAANIILLNKIDLLPDGEAEALAGRLNALNPGAVIVPTVNASVHPDLLYAAHGDDMPETTPLPQLLSDDVDLAGQHKHHEHHEHTGHPSHHGHHEHHEHHGHGLHAHHDHSHVGAVRIGLDTPLNEQGFLQAVNALPPSVFRVKGVLDLVGRDSPMLFQYVGGRFELTPFTPPKNDGDRFLICIGKDLDQEELGKRLVGGEGE